MIPEAQSMGGLRSLRGSAKVSDSHKATTLEARVLCGNTEPEVVTPIPRWNFLTNVYGRLTDLTTSQAQEAGGCKDRCEMSDQ